MALDVFVGEVFRHPAALEYSGATCQHGCAYCYATAHGKESKDGTKGFVNFLYKKERTSYKDALFTEGYPFLLSNRTDPFSPNNIESTEGIFGHLKEFPNGVIIQTKGGHDIEETLGIIDIFGPQKAVVYMTISPTTPDEKKLKILEPGAPDLGDRLALALSLREKGYHVVAAFNPMYEPWADQTDTLAIYNVLTGDTDDVDDDDDDDEGFKGHEITHFYVQGLHLSPRRQAGYAKERLSRLMAGEPGEFVYDPDKAHGYAMGFALYVKEHGKECYIPAPFIYEHDFWQPLQERFKVMPTNEGFMAHCHQKLIASGKDSIRVTFEDYAAYMTKGWEKLFCRNFPKGQIDRYIFSANLTLWKKYQDINSLMALLNVLWNNRHLSGILNNHAFWPVGEGKATAKDGNGDNLYDYNGSINYQE